MENQVKKLMKNSKIDKLREYREKIDNFDIEIVELLNKRAEYAIKIGKFKKSSKREIIDYNREKDVISNILNANKGRFPENDLINIYREIIAATRKLQESYKVSFLGPKGTFSSIVFKKFFGENSDYLMRDSIKKVFLDVTNGYSKFGIVPVENSLEGSVNETLECLFTNNIKIWAELSLKVSFNLISKGKKENIKKIVSHSHALAQCRDYIYRNFPNIETDTTSSTAKAAELAENDPSVAAIVAPGVEKLYNIPVIVENLDISANNFTRFYVVSLDENRVDVKDKSSIVFAISHKPKALFNVLKVIADFNLNMCKIESFPLKGIPWEYLFFVDIEGDLNEDFIENLKDKTTYFKNLGTYPVENL
jgi:chorismate mutase/prephenate dehydratase